jgi:hypothetical protein
MVNVENRSLMRTVADDWRTVGKMNRPHGRRILDATGTVQPVKCTPIPWMTTSWTVEAMPGRDSIAPTWGDPKSGERN